MHYHHVSVSNHGDNAVAQSNAHLKIHSDLHFQDKLKKLRTSKISTVTNACVIIDATQSSTHTYVWVQDASIRNKHYSPPTRMYLTTLHENSMNIVIWDGIHSCLNTKANGPSKRPTQKHQHHREIGLKSFTLMLNKSRNKISCQC